MACVLVYVEYAELILLSIVIVFVAVFVKMVILLPGRIESISLLLVAITNDEFELIVANEFDDEPLERYFISPVVLA